MRNSLAHFLDGIEKSSDSNLDYFDGFEFVESFDSVS